MGKASISIAISGAYNGAAIDRAEKSLERLAARTAAAEGSMSKSFLVPMRQPPCVPPGPSHHDAGASALPRQL